MYTLRYMMHLLHVATRLTQLGHDSLATCTWYLRVLAY